MSDHTFYIILATILVGNMTSMVVFLIWGKALWSFGATRLVSRSDEPVKYWWIIVSQTSVAGFLALVFWRPMLESLASH